MDAAAARDRARSPPRVRTSRAEGVREIPLAAVARPPLAPAGRPLRAGGPCHRCCQRRRLRPRGRPTSQARPWIGAGWSESSEHFPDAWECRRSHRNERRGCGSGGHPARSPARRGHSPWAGIDTRCGVCGTSPQPAVPVPTPYHAARPAHGINNPNSYPTTTFRCARPIHSVSRERSRAAAHTPFRHQAGRRVLVHRVCTGFRSRGSSQGRA